MEFTLALVQFDIAPSDPATNLARMEEFVQKAVKKGANIVVFPEDAITGPLEGQYLFIEHASEYLSLCQALAVKYAVDLVPGSWTVQEGEALYNAAYYINKDGSVAGSYYKINLWETEKARLAPGSAVSVFPTAYGMFGLTICWDISFPAIFSEMARQGVQIVISPTYWSFPPAATTDEKIHDEILLIDSLCTTRAFENNIVFAYCNAAGEIIADGVHSVLSGRSQITHPADKVLAKATENQEELVIAAIHLP